MRLNSLIFVVLCAMPSCTKASESGDAKRMPKPPPSPSAEVTGTLRISVLVDDQPMPPIDAARLAATKADFEDDDRRAWKMVTLLGAAAGRDGVAIAVTGAKGLTLVARPTKNPADPIPVLMTSRRGEAHFALVPAGEPFPAYHGRGGQLNRPGDPLPRISGVTEIRVYIDKNADAAR
ncbi:MAG: hypothetical protein ABIP39_02105 [Polyangiaceae bacterium]